MLSYTFEVFGNDHVSSIILIILIYVFLLRYNKHMGISNSSQIFPIFLSCFIVALDISEDIIRIITQHYSLREDLPLQLCNIGIYLSVIALLKKNQTAFELIFFWGLVGASQAIITPDGDLFELKIFFIYSQAYHSTLIFIVLWLMVKNGMRMKIKSIPKIFLITNLVVIFIALINYSLDSNYMFLSARPNSVSPFLVGEWPVYIIMVQFFSIVVLTLFIKIQDLFLNPTNS